MSPRDFDPARERERARSALFAIDAGLDRDEWVRAGMAAKAAGLDFEDFDAWSSSAGNYGGESDCRSVWRGIKDDRGIGPATLFRMARDAGWSDEAIGYPRQAHQNANPRTQPRPKKDNTPKRPSFDVEALWAAGETATTAHGYVVRKRGVPTGLRVYRGPLKIAGEPMNGSLMVPAYDLDGVLKTVQFIPEGKGRKKLNAPGLPMDGLFVTDTIPCQGGVLYIVEGIGQAWSCSAATGAPAVVAFGAGRMEAVSKALAEHYPQTRRVLVADTGKEELCAGIAKKTGAAWVEMPAGSPPNFDANDLDQRDGLEALAALLTRPKLPPSPEVWPNESGSIQAFLDAPPPRLSWFANERLLANRAHLLTGVGGTSKSTLAYHLGVGAVIGRVPWGWEIERTGSSLLLMAEDDAANVHRMVASFATHGGLTPDEMRLVAAKMRVFPMAGRSSRLLAFGPNGTLTETPEAHGLMELVKGIPDLRLIALDPALGLTEGDELSAAHQRRLGEFVDRLALAANACVVLISHAAKSSNSADELSSHTSRGSGAITDAVRGEFALRTMTQAEGKRFGVTDIAERRAYVQLAMTKGNNAPPEAFAPVWLKRGMGGLLSLAELTESESGAVGTRETKALEILRQLAQRSTPMMKDWRDACIAAGLLSGKSDSAREKTMERIRDTLKSAGLIEAGMTRGAYIPVDPEEEVAS